MSFVFKDLGCVGLRAEGLRLGLLVSGFVVLSLASVTSLITRTYTPDGFQWSRFGVES
jgi:hypothetical protein